MRKSLKDFGIDPDDMIEEDAASLAGELLSFHNLPHKIWVRGDIESELDDMLASNEKELSDTKREEIVEWAWENKRLQRLSECTEGDWQLIHDVIHETADERYIDIV